MKRTLPALFLLSLCLLLPLRASDAADAPAFDPQLAARHGLSIPPAASNVDGPAPEWVRRAEVVTHSKAAWLGYQFTLRGTPVTRIVRARSGHARVTLTGHHPVETVRGLDAASFRGVPLLSHVPHSADAFRLAHEQGIRAIPYVHFMCIRTDAADQDVFHFQHPEILLKDAAGHWVHTGMDGSDRLHRFLTCANSPGYWKLSLAYVKKLMEQGADGVFIDNCGRRKPCFAPRFNQVRNPEFDPYVHEHLFPDASHDQAWERFLDAVRALIKSYGEDKVVILNSSLGDPWQRIGDCCMWESFIYSWAWQGRRHTWADVKAKAKANQWFLDAGRRVVALAFLDPERHDMKEDPFWAYACARLVDFILWADLGHTDAEYLYRLRLGAGLGPFQESGQVAHRFFERGLIVLNDGKENREVALRVPAGFTHKRLVALQDGSAPVPVTGDSIKVRVPAGKARIYAGTDPR